MFPSSITRKKKTKSNMPTINENQLSNAQELVNKMSGKNVKYIKKDKGLIEREDLKDEQVILMEDNRQVLFG